MFNANDVTEEFSITQKFFDDEQMIQMVDWQVIFSHPEVTYGIGGSGRSLLSTPISLSSTEAQIKQAISDTENGTDGVEDYWQWYREQHMQPLNLLWIEENLDYDVS